MTFTVQCGPTPGPTTIYKARNISVYWETAAENIVGRDHSFVLSMRGTKPDNTVNECTFTISHAQLLELADAIQLALIESRK